MWASKINKKLTLHFILALLSLIFIMISVFNFIFRWNTTNIYKESMEARAIGISENITKGFANSSLQLTDYLELYISMNEGDIWVVAPETGTMFGGGALYSVNELPNDAEQIINEALNGKTEFSENFSTVINSATLTVGTPIYSMSGERVIGVLLLHQPISGINALVSSSLLLLTASIAGALFVASIIAYILSRQFTDPLHSMKNTALALADGDYSAKTGVSLNDEIGELATVIDNLSDRLYDAKNQSDRLDLLRRDFLSNVSHELKTPVTVIKGSLEALNDKIITDPDEIDEYHRQMLKESELLSRLVLDLLDLSKLQHAEFDIERDEVNLCEVINDTIRSCRQLALNRNIEVVLNRDCEMHSYIGDYGRLRQMFMIVLDNAIKFSPENGIVRVSFENNILSITDNGIGVPKEDMPYIFDRFYKSRHEKNKEGTGLGLPIAKEIASRHNIKMTLESSQGSYTTFFFDFN